MVVVVMTEALQILFGVLKQGRYITMKPYMVISGCMSGSGFILIILQTGPFPGQAIPKGGVMGKLTALPQLFAAARLPEVILAVVTMAIIWFTPAQVTREWATSFQVSSAASQAPKPPWAWW